MSRERTPVRVRRVRNCSACGREHRIPFKKLSHPHVIQGVAYTAVATCPSTGKLIFVEGMKTK